jgi:hypothetical protein
MPRAIYSLPEPRRSAEISVYIGHWVIVEHWPTRNVDGFKQDIHGQLEGVAQRTAGASAANVAILRTSAGLLAISVAEIHNIRKTT